MRRPALVSTAATLSTVSMPLHLPRQQGAIVMYPLSPYRCCCRNVAPAQALLHAPTGLDASSSGADGPHFGAVELRGTSVRSDPCGCVILLAAASCCCPILMSNINNSHPPLCSLHAEPNLSRSKPDRIWQRLAAVRVSDFTPAGDGGSQVGCATAVPYSIWRCSSEAARAAHQMTAAP